MDKISRKQYEAMKREMSEGMYRYRTQQDTTDDIVTEVLDGVLEIANTEVEPPPILPGVTPGTWEAVAGEDYNIVTSGRHIAIIKARASKCQQFSMGELRHPDNDEALANAKLMAASKEVVEKGCKIAALLHSESEVTHSVLVEFEKVLQKAGAKI